ncbi:MAG: hypothetical protein K9L88_15055 [Chromatiaceae bacterium]|nr:hypothetical protein [Chromatiaceae bacterium]
MLYVYVTDQCWDDAARINTRSVIEGLQQKLTYDQSTSGLQRHPYPFLKKRIARTRVVMAEVLDGEDLVVCFLRHVYKKEIGDNYDTFFSSLEIPKPNEPALATFLAEARATPIAIKDPPSHLELEYLILKREQEIGRLRILESPLWISTIRTLKETQGKQGLLTPIWEILQEICDDDNKGRESRCEQRHPRHDVRVLYRHFPANNTVFLVAPLEVAATESESVAVSAESLLESSATFNDSQLLRNAARAYPDFILYDREIWESTQASIDANLALSPEESDVLSHVLDPMSEGGFPLFINGRPGSGKSTILQYLFAEYLHAHLARPLERRLPCPPLYLTYNERLLENARKLVEDIFHCGAEKLAANELVDLHDKQQRNEFDRAFVYFRAFLESLLGSEAFDSKKYLDFNRFRMLYSENFSHGPDSKLRRLAPEVAWHTVRTYIKGKNAGDSDYFDPESYAELPRDEITVTPETFELVWDKVWNGWYRILCEQSGFWDDQDLARRVLDRDLVPSDYPAVFCDEAQDFTTVELELIFRLSRFSTKHVDSFYLRRIPYAFAGDPFQTLNPTGFRWDTIKANFHDNIVRQLDSDRRGKISFTFKELAYNYRSTTNIVRFCNLIQLKRADLFDVVDVAPQKAWAVSEGATPAYFQLDIGTEGKLKDQTELVIIVPCQEGEEKEFVEQDPYLRTIALNKKGEIIRSVLSPMRAKGLEFGRVVLYKFGDKAVVVGHVEIMQKLATNSQRGLEREQTLGLEYFFNGAYVAASRAQRRLLVVDTERGLKEFWSFATDASAIGALLSGHTNAEWDQEDLHHMMPGGSATWSEERDDPRDLAIRFFGQGRLEQSTYLLQLARNYYAAVGDAERTERCTALIHDIDGEYREAAESYARLNELEDAVRCYWQGKAYTDITATSTRDPGRFATNPFVVATRFITSKAEPDRAVQFVRDLYGIPAERRRSQFKCSHWPDVVQQAVKLIGGDAKDSSPVSSETAAEVFRDLSRMRDEDGLSLDRTLELALLAYRAGDPVAALDIWKDVERKTNARDPVFILRARATTTPYPEQLRWYEQLQDHEAIVVAFKEHETSELEEDYRPLVAKALVKSNDYVSAVCVVKESQAWQGMRWLLEKLPVSTVGLESAQRLLGSYLRTALGGGEFRQVIEDLKPTKTDVPVLKSLLSGEKWLLASEAGLIRILARSAALVEERADDNFISGSILTIAKKRVGKLKNLVSPEEVGAALERAGRMDNALAFYESVFRDKAWGSDRSTEYSAKERWLRCKVRQAELQRKDDRKKSQRLAEAKRLSSEWGVEIPDNEFPALKALAPHEIDALIDAQDSQSKAEPADSPAVILPGHQPVDARPSQDALATGKSKLNEQGVVPDVIKPNAVDEPVKGGVEPSKQEVFSLPLPQREALNGRVELLWNCEGTSIKAKLLPSKRRLELTDESNDDLVQIKVGKLAVESDDVPISVIDDLTWRIDPWSLTVSMVVASNNTTLVDFSDSGGRRILCLNV